jgi:hypothetical protein
MGSFVPVCNLNGLLVHIYIYIYIKTSLYLLFELLIIFKQQIISDLGLN